MQTVLANQTKGLKCSVMRTQAFKATPRPQCTRPRFSRSVSPRIVCNAAFSPVTVSDTKRNFITKYKKPIAGVYASVIQELLVQMHFIRHNTKYDYNEVFALGVVSVYDQILESFSEDERKTLFNAIIEALAEKPDTFRTDASRLEQTASNLSSPDELTPNASGSEVQQVLARIAERSASGNFAYNKFFAIGLFRLLELTGAKEPAALEKLVKATGVRQENVNRDLMLYKGILSKLSAAKELQKEFIEREKRKQAEREAEKAARAQKAEGQQGEGSTAQA